MLEEGSTECVRFCRQMSSKDYGTWHEPHLGHTEYPNPSLCHYAKGKFFLLFLSSYEIL